LIYALFRDHLIEKRNFVRRPLIEVNQQAINLLYKELGVIDAVRFLKQFTQGYGNYTQERETIFANERYQPRGKPRTLSSAASGGVLDPKGNKSLDDIVGEIEKRRKTAR
jgi:hypothetical protein